MVGNVQRSCIGERNSCDGLGANAGAVVGDVQDSCIGTYSCYDLGKDGSVQHVEDSCSGTRACFMLGKKGAVGNVQDSCNESNACRHGGFFGTMKNIASSCNAYRACFDAGRGATVSGVNQSIFSDLNNCCNVARECEAASQSTLAGTCPGVRRVLLPFFLCCCSCLYHRRYSPHDCYSFWFPPFVARRPAALVLVPSLHTAHLTHQPQSQQKVRHLQMLRASVLIHHQVQQLH